MFINIIILRNKLIKEDSTKLFFFKQIILSYSFHNEIKK